MRIRSIASHSLGIIPPFYRLPALPILPVNCSIFTILPVNFKPGKSSTLAITPETNSASPIKRIHHNFIKVVLASKQKV
jgi:hypothetical protein